MSTIFDEITTPPRSTYPGFTDEDWRLSLTVPDKFDRVGVQALEHAYDVGHQHDAKHRDYDHPWCASCALRSWSEVGVASIESLEDRDKRLGTECCRRAFRYLLLHGRPPVDVVDAGDFDDLYLDGSDLDDLPQPRPLIAGVLERDTYAVLRGRDASFKSFVALDWALSLATGTPWLGRPTEVGRVLYIAGEGVHGIGKRKRAWEADHGRDVDPYAFVVRRAALNMHRPGPAFTDLLRRVEQGAFTLVVVDTLRRVAGAADGNGSDMAAVVDNLDRIKQATADGTVLALAHTDKGDNDTRGYSGIEDDADTVWHAKRPDGDERFTLELTKQKDGPDGLTLDLQVEPAHDSLVIRSAFALLSEKVGSSEQTILNVLAESSADEKGITTAELLDLTKLTRSTTYGAVTKLQRAGLIRDVSPTSTRRWVRTVQGGEIG